MSWRIHESLEKIRCHINQLFNIKNVSIKDKFTILKSNIVSCVLNFSKNYYDESHGQILNLRSQTSTSKFE